MQGFSWMFGDLLHEGNPDEVFEDALAWLVATVREWWREYKQWAKDNPKEAGLE